MCGIFGITNIGEREIEKARASLHTLKHRGPDGWGEFYREGVYLGHRRLSILDLSYKGQQPMVSDDGNTAIAVNGEIYNFKKIRNELKNKYHFVSDCDSEVILHGYREWGIKKLLSKIEGMFAFTIFDRNEHKIFLIRDRMGIKPLYYSKIGNQVSWASELKGIEQFYDNLDKEKTAYYDFLTYKYVPTPKTIYKNVYKLEPAHYLKINTATNKIQKNRYWSLQVGNRKVRSEQAKQKIEELVSESVQEQMMSDVPVGFFLSGGLDSSTIVALASESNAKEIKTFSIGFSDKSHDETHYADLVADRYKTTHEKRILNSEAVENLFPKLKKWYDEPFSDTSAFPTYLVSKIARENVKVVLTGDGGDEIFGGYKRYNRFKKFYKSRHSLMNPLKKITQRFSTKKSILGKVIKRVELALVLDDLELYTRLLGDKLHSDPVKKNLRKEFKISNDYDDYWYFRKYYKKELPLMTRLQYLDFHTYLHDDILTKVDRVSMAVSLECRVPFLNTNLVEYLFSLHEETRNKGYNLKYLMKETFKEKLPAEIVGRKKKGFSIPRSSWQKKLVNSSHSYQTKIMYDFLNKN